ncbi:GIY-YIG nuclease family protein [Candidatus Microgenomates bacterium]|nr:GIY-YIG nuclease family protein [Candidatus Microgenomates bacterium]
MSHSYYIYIISNYTNKVLYTGVTRDLRRRIYEHKNELIDGFSKKYKLRKLIYFEEYISIHEAIVREKQLKNWHREWKMNLIQSKNPSYKDLSYLLD